MRALVLSDIHGNLEALNAVLASAEGGYDVAWNLGDVVGYGASPNEVTEIIRQHASYHVRGNHDRVCCGTASAVGFNPVARAAAEWTKQELTEENRAWLAAMPQGPLTPEGYDEIALAHGSPLNEDQYIVSMRDAWAPLQQPGIRLTFIGHTHLQGGFMQRDQEWQELRPHYATRNDAESWVLELGDDRQHLINPGSIGQPRDGDWRAAYAIYDTEAKTITYHRVPYDLTAAQGRILMAGLPEKLAARLREGR